jgi:type I restriction enzyme S subunit
MKSNYEKLGKYIREIDDRNAGDIKENLLGVSTRKVFIESIANTIGTDFTTYRLIKRGQFAYVPDTSRRGDKIGVALLDHVDEGMISQAYTVFEVTDENSLLPEYLMMWFRRPEFDRYARYMSYGSVREIFSWEDMCDLELPVPHIDKQREIVKEYNTILRRIDLNKQLIQKLEETAQAIYKQWFVDFEFPNENGEPYKSAGGEMVESELGDIPKEWEVKTVGDLVKCNYATLTPKDKFDDIEYLDTSNITNNEIEEIQTINIKSGKVPSRAKRKVEHGSIVFSTVRPSLRHFGILRSPKPNMIVSTGFAVLQPTHPNLYGELIYLLITNEENLKNLQAIAEMSVSTYPSINPEDLLRIRLSLPTKNILSQSSKVFDSLFKLLDQKKKEKGTLLKLNQLLLSKLATVTD